MVILYHLASVMNEGNRIAREVTQRSSSNEFKSGLCKERAGSKAVRVKIEEIDEEEYNAD